MNLILKRLTLANARLGLLTWQEANLHAQYLELVDLREQLREAQLLADLRDATRAPKPAPDVIAAVA